MNKLLQILQNRTSHRNLIEPHPNSDEMAEVYKTALRSPDHAWLKPSRFIEVTGEGPSPVTSINLEGCLLYTSPSPRDS